MPAIKEEVDAALAEGVEIDFLVAPKKLIFDQNNKLIALECIRMELGPPDESGRAKPIPIPNSEFQIPTDAIFKAIGEYLHYPEQDAKVAIENKQIKIVSNYQTTRERVFACGDCANNSGTVGDAIKRGREAAYAIHTFLEYPQEFKEGKVYYPDVARERGAAEEQAKFKTFNIAYFKKEPPIEIPEAPLEQRNNFEEIEKTITTEQAQKEACRCFKCGTCVFCDNCRVFCPELAITFDGTRYHINYEYCKGCGVCVEECPRNAIHLREVNIEK
jgi:Pyruvate/2-oxoacid:ferredoxin oxidoreductase delta subunit